MPEPTQEQAAAQHNDNSRPKKETALEIRWIPGPVVYEQAGYNPRAALEVFDIFEKHLPNTTPEFLQNHPLNKSRIQALARKYPNVRS